MHPTPRTRRAPLVAAVGATALPLIAPGLARAVSVAPPPNPTVKIVSSNAGPNLFTGVNINQFVGAETFYFNGYAGQRAVIANIEAGHVWNGHESLTHVATYLNDPSVSPPSGRQYDWHATMVGHVLNGRGILYGIKFDDFDFATYYGIAPGSTLWSGQVASSWVPDPNPANEFTGSFNVTDASLIYPYKIAMQTGVAGRKADVINSSWGYDDPAGKESSTIFVDALAYQNHNTVVFAAGNHDPADVTAQVNGAASGYNGLAVAALSPDTSNPPYNAVADFSNTGANDFYNPKTGTTKRFVRAGVDIAAPGDNLTLAFYGGLTGGHTSGTDPTAGPNQGQYYIPDMGGTSFAAPVVAGGAALVVDAGYANFAGGTSVDGRVVKAVLLNSARKTPGWNNGQSLQHGVVTTTQSLDFAVGAGALDLDKAYHQYLDGTHDLPGTSGGTVQPVGWDFATSTPGAPNDYSIASDLRGGTTFNVTLDWFVARTFDATSTDVADVQFIDLDLQVFRLVSPGNELLVAQSVSTYNNTEHLSFLLPADGHYFLRVSWNGEIYDLPGNTPDATDYALAWSGTAVPEPSIAATCLVMALIPFGRRPRLARGKGL